MFLIIICKRKEILDAEFNKNGKEFRRLEDLIQNSIFSLFDPVTQKLKFDQSSETGRTYTANSMIHAFGECIKVASIRKMDVVAFRRPILNYIPFADLLPLNCNF